MAGRKPGGPKTGGRKAGTANKKTVEAQEIADRNGINPFEILVWFAQGNWEKLGYDSQRVTKYGASGLPYQEDVISPELRQSSAGKAVEYLYPKRKAIEQSITDNTVTTITRTVINKAVER